MNNAECKRECQRQPNNANGKPQEDNAQSRSPVGQGKPKDDNASLANAEVGKKQIAEVDDEFERKIKPSDQKMRMS